MKRKIMAIILVVVLSAAIWAEPMTLDRTAAVQLALVNNPDFQVAGINLETAAREDRNSWNAFLPSISASAGLDGGSSLLDSRPNTIAWSVSGALNFSLPINASLAYSIRGLQLAYESQELGYESARLGLIAAVEKEFYYLIAVEKNLKIEEANLRLARERYDQTNTNYQNGLASELEALQAEVSAANLEPAYLQIVADFETRVREFLIVLGLDPETPITLEGSLEIPSVEFNSSDLISRYLGGRQDILLLQKNLETLKNSKSQTVASARTPSLNLSAGWRTNVGDPFNAGSWESGTWTDGLSLGMSVNIPLDSYIPGSSDSVKIKSIQDDIDIASINLAKAIQEARTEIINLVSQLKTSSANMGLSALNVELARRSFELSHESFSRGMVQRLDVEDAQQAYLEANQQHLVSQYEYLSGLINLRSALGLKNLQELI